MAHLVDRQGVKAPAIAEWWPLLWATDIDQYARPFSCPALAAFDWPEAPDSCISPDEGWDEWERSVQRTDTFAPTLQTLRDAKTGAAPWLPATQDTGADATGPSPRG
eukprot:3477032-Pyramimonas_sp.AAC.1